VNSLKKLSVQTLDLKEISATKLAYLDGVLAVGCITRAMSSVTGELFQAGNLELRDPVSLNGELFGGPADSEIARMPLLGREVVTCLQPVMLLGRLYLAAGTAIFSSDADFEDAVLDNEYRVTAKEGRVLVVEPDKEMSVVTTLKTVGPVHDLKVIHGFLAVAAASRVSQEIRNANPDLCKPPNTWTHRNAH
jgi:DNA damage-binding protein 1